MSDQEIQKRLFHAIAREEEITCTQCQRSFKPHAGTYGLMCPYCKSGQVFTSKEPFDPFNDMRKRGLHNTPLYKSFSDLLADMAKEQKHFFQQTTLLRELLFLRHGCSGPALYGDDGERQCSACGIDFKRDSAEAISDRWSQIGLAKLAAAQKL